MDLHRARAQARAVLHDATAISRSYLLTVAGVWVPPRHAAMTEHDRATAVMAAEASPEAITAWRNATARRDVVSALIAGRERAHLSQTDVAHRINPELSGDDVAAFERGAWSSLGFAQSYASAVGMQLTLRAAPDRLRAVRHAVQRAVVRSELRAQRNERCL